MNVFVNGETLTYPDGTTVDQVVAAMGLTGKRIAVEFNKEILPFDSYAKQRLKEGDRLEIVHAIGGGQDDSFTVAGRIYRSRLLVGTGKYKDMEETRLAIEASGAEIVTVAIRRTNIGQTPGEPNLLDVISPDKYTILPNTAGCYTADDAVRTCRLGRELLGGHNLVKLEVLADQKTLFPDVAETYKAAELLVKDGFDVMVYTNDDPIAAKRLEEIGCVAVMPLAAPIGSGLGIRNPYNILTIVENASVPILVDAGVGTASDAAIAMELGCAGVLMNTAIAAAQNPVLMAEAMKKGIEAGRLAFLAGRMPRKRFASASSPIDGLFL
ncbi:sulfur carrier protein ThiS [Methylicorpusculum sp.]|uniref:sulfur carrier protein ThiS n=1 Tax=Methylicorpusculum sp. TaxID=2713644 RepID=UPI0027317A5C|nr:sulfur carrier protein ThiS [Methylicorpusculum sp.]MDP2179950.1 sulfur carrier protein ThiS [Methylicorpusculum sp.]MDP3530343.1 sulfur carrier protein ThiS [Methylicorpusculum sp.]MDZ4151997.1 sulfur carrier protein ThiS [Methylicorpusculum sp.]